VNDARSGGAERSAGVAIIAHTRETLDSLEDHMRTVGLEPRRSRFIGHWQEMVPGSCLLAVLFPDEFPAASVDGMLADLESHRVALFVVTNDRRRFEGWRSRDHANHLLLSKPVWTWNLIDSIRSWILLSGSSRANPSCR